MSHLKHCSREAGLAWCSADCPNVGPIMDDYLVSRRNYKYAVREAKHNDKVSCANRLLELSSNKNSKQFWSTFRRNCEPMKRNSTALNANSFVNQFQNNFINSADNMGSLMKSIWIIYIMLNIVILI